MISRDQVERFRNPYEAKENTAAISGLPPYYLVGFEPSISEGRLTIGSGTASVDGTSVSLGDTLITDSHWAVNKVGSFTYYIYVIKSGDFLVDIIAPTDANRVLSHPYRDGRYIMHIEVDTNLDISLAAKALPSELSAGDLSNATARDQLALQLGYTDYATMVTTVSTDGSIITSGGYLRADLIEAESIVASMIATSALQTLIANISYQLTIGFGGTGDLAAPDDGDRRVYVDEDELRFQEHNGEAWENRGYIAQRTGSNVFDGFVSGFFSAAEGVQSSLGLIYNEASNNLVTSSGTYVASGNGTTVAWSNNDLNLSTDGGKTWGTDVTHTSITVCQATGFGNDVFLAGGSGGLIKSTNDGVTWGSLITNPLTTAGDTIRGLAYDPDNGIWVMSGSSTTYLAWSDDDGDTWNSPTTLPASTPAIVWRTHYAGNGVFIAQPYTSDSIWRSTDGGDIWTEVAIDGTSSLDYVDSIATKPDDGVTVVFTHDSTDDSAWIYRSVDYGVTWDLVLTLDAADWTNGLIFSAPGYFYMEDYVSIDGGQTWTVGLNGHTINLPLMTDLTYDSVNESIIAGVSGGLTYYSEWLEAGAGIVEAGTDSGTGLYYEKYSNGTIHLYGTVSDTVAINTAAGTYGGYYAYGGYHTFDTGRLTQFIWAEMNSGSAFAASPGAGTDEDNFRVMYRSVSSTGSASRTAYVHIIGRWK